MSTAMNIHGVKSVTVRHVSVPYEHGPEFTVLKVVIVTDADEHTLTLFSDELLTVTDGDADDQKLAYLTAELQRAQDVEQVNLRG